MPMSATRLGHALPALILAAASSASLAQSSYSVTVLKSPTSYAMEASDMDNTGKVVGHTSVLAFAVTEFGTGLLAPALKARQQGATWSANTASSITGSKTANYYVPFRIGESGVTLGFKTSAAEQIPGVTLFADQGGTIKEVLTYREPYYLSQLALGGTNKAGVVAATAWKAPGDDLIPFGAAAVLVKDGAVSQVLERPAGVWGTYAHSLNDSGTVAGTIDGYTREVTEGVDYNIQAAVWADGKLSWVGPLQTEARVVNNAGQVLVAKGRSVPRSQEGGANDWRYKDIGNPVKGSAFVLLGTSKQTIGRDDQVVNATDMNNAGTVVGCIDKVPFIWKNGVLLDLVKEVNSKGAKLSTSVVVECPIAINDSGSILTSYRASQSSTSRTWVRINAKP